MNNVIDRVQDRRQDVARVESPFDGWPATHFLRAAHGGLAGIVIEPVVLTPVPAKFATFLGFVSIFGTMAGCLALVAAARDPAPYWWLLAIALPLMLGVPVRALCRQLFRQRCRLVFTPEHFSVQRGAGRSVLYDRQEAHRFRLDARHRKARKEAERHQKIAMQAQMNRRVASPEKYYTECLHLMIDYRGQPRKVMEIMGQEEALLVLARVKLVDEVMERLVAMGDVAAKGAQSEWDDMPGKIPEKV